MMKLKLYVPGLREMDARQKWLADPATMAYNAGQPFEADGYDAATGCIEFPMGDWRYWRDVWLWREPNRYSAYLMDEETGTFVGEACYYYDMDSDSHGTGILIAAEHRNKGCGTEGLRLLVQQAFRHEEIDTLFATLPVDREDAVRMYLTNGFREVGCVEGIVRLELKKQEGAR